MRERKAYKPRSHPGDHLRRQIGDTAYDTLTGIASAPAGGIVAPMKIVAKIPKIKKIIHDLTHPKHTEPKPKPPPKPKPKPKPKPPPKPSHRDDVLPQAGHSLADYDKKFMMRRRRAG